MKKDHSENTVGPWAENKLQCLEKYLEFYNTALRKQNFERIYIDAFAGSCVSKVRNADAIVEASPLLGEQLDAEAHDQFVLGSPVRALNIPQGFHRHYFFDLDETRAAMLESLSQAFPKKLVTVEVGDSNPLIRNLSKKMNGPNIRGVAFLDPYGPHLEWATVEALAATKNFEVIINFPAAMAINRLITKSRIIPEKWNGMLTACFGTDAWNSVAYEKTVDMFGHETFSKRGGVSEKLLDLYVERLKRLFAHVAKPRLIRNTRNAPLYYLIWAGPNKLGLKGAEYILAQGEKLKI